MCQCTNTLVSDSHGLLYFALSLVEFIHRLLNSHEEVLAELFWGNSFHSSYLTEFFGAVENYFWASTFCLQPEGQAGKLIFFAPCIYFID